MYSGGSAVEWHCQKRELKRAKKFENYQQLERAVPSVCWLEEFKQRAAIASCDHCSPLKHFTGAKFTLLGNSYYNEGINFFGKNFLGCVTQSSDDGIRNQSHVDEIKISELVAYWKLSLVASLVTSLVTSLPINSVAQKVRVS